MIADLRLAAARAARRGNYRLAVRLRAHANRLALIETRRVLRAAQERRQ